MFHVKQMPLTRNDVSRETYEKLDGFVTLLLKWNKTINLISRSDEQHVWRRHVDESLDIARTLPASFSHAVDLGSGAGFPGLVLAILTGRPFHLIEADQRKAAFLREATRQTSAPVTIYASRIEVATPPKAPVVTARALAPISKLVTWALPHLAPQGVCVFPKGSTYPVELSDARRKWHMRVEATPSRLVPSASILTISEITRADTA